MRVRKEAKVEDMGRWGRKKSAMQGGKGGQKAGCKGEGRREINEVRRGRERNMEELKVEGGKDEAGRESTGEENRCKEKMRELRDGTKQKKEGGKYHQDNILYNVMRTKTIHRICKRSNRGGARKSRSMQDSDVHDESFT